MRNSRASRTTMKWQTLARLFKGEGGGSRRLAKKPPTCNHIHVSQALNNMDQIATSSWETTHWSTIRTSSPAGPSHLLHVICARSKQHLYSPLSFQNLYRIKIVPHQHYMCLPLRIITLSRQELDLEEQFQANASASGCYNQTRAMRDLNCSIENYKN
ncbi:hypothetical protein Peur_040371 [Populus x canadensis]